MTSKKVRLRIPVAGLRMRSRDNLVRLRETRLRPIGILNYKMLLLLPIMLGLIIVTALLRQTGVQEKRFHPSDEETVMPLSGWAVRADTWAEERLLDTGLVYAELTWAELETEPGVYDFEGFEERNHLKQWWAEGKRVILRFVTDRPSEAVHKDIPEWLVEDMGGEVLAGAFYETGEGCGFTPDYSNLIMREAHYRVIEALAGRYDGHPGVAYVEIGSLGAGGLWTQGPDRERGNLLPVSTVSREYAWNYTNAFSKTPLLMCRPYKEAELLTLGLFNPRLGDFEATWDYLDVIQEGGYDDQIGTDLVAVPDFYLHAPSGAHVPADIDLEQLLTGKRESLARQMRESRLNYAVLDGDISMLSSEALRVLHELEGNLGGRLWVRSARWDEKVHSTMRATLYIRFRNDGEALLHGNWPIALALFDGDKMICCQTTGLDSSMLVPGETGLRAWLDVPYGTPVGAYTIKLAILDPGSGLPGVPLMMEECDEETLWTELGELNVIS